MRPNNVAISTSIGSGNMYFWRAYLRDNVEMKCVVVFMAEAPVPNYAPPVSRVVVTDSTDSDVALPEFLVVRNR